MARVTHYPPVSVIMPVRNEAHYIMRSVRAVLEQDYPPELLEIIIADGLSEDNTVDLIRSLPDTRRIQIIANAYKIQAAGLNAALRIACGEVIVRVDGHTIIAPDYVRRCVEVLALTHAENVGGALHPVGETITGLAIALASRSRFAVPATFRISTTSQYVDTVYMGAWPRRVFNQIGLFDERFAVNEDYELNFRIRMTGGHIYFSPDICSVYHGQETLITLAKQYFRYGMSKPKTLLKHPYSLRFRHVAAPVFVLFIACGVPLGLLSPQWVIAWMVGIIIYFWATVGFSLYAGRAESLSVIARIPLVFITIHCAWGSGFWSAILQMLRSIAKGKSISLS